MDPAMPTAASRITIRRMLLAVAVFAVTLNVGLSYRMSAEYRRRALFFTRAGESTSSLARNVESGVLRMQGYTEYEKRRVVEQARQMIEYAGRMKWKYECAAYLPWLPLKPDPPPPGMIPERDEDSPGRD
jgi:hypothetical protein